MNELRRPDDLFAAEEGYLTFEQLKKENGMTYWLASDLMERLGYGDDMKSFYRAIKRANKTMDSLNIDPFDNIIKFQRNDGGTLLDDYRLSRFASYLVVMNADPKKPEVAKAQAYFVAMAQQMEMLLNDPEQVARLAIREEIKEGNLNLSSTAKRANVRDYARFQNAGYLGMYNMMNVSLARKRGIDKDELIDHMGRAEMAANLFRITMTEKKIENENIRGQNRLENVHRGVGKKVRDMVKDITGEFPEDLPVEKKLPEVRSQLKKDYKKMLENAPETKKDQTNKEK